jgi:hypothetical protein
VSCTDCSSFYSVFKSRLFSLKKKHASSEDLKTAAKFMEDLSDSKSSQSGHVVCGRMLLVCLEFNLAVNA